MTTTTLIKITTKTGKVAAEVTGITHTSGRTTYQWSGAWGAGCGSLDDIRATLRVSMKTRKGWTVVYGEV